MMPFISALWLKLIGALVVIGAILAAIAKIFYEGKKAGTAEVVEEVRGTTEAVREKFDHIDAQKPDADAALERLRKRSDSQGDLPTTPAATVFGAKRTRGRDGF